ISVVASGQDGVAGAGTGAVGEGNLLSWGAHGGVETVLPGTLIELSDSVTSRGQQQTAPTRILVGVPGCVR
ncbi:hypothetical protein QCD71_25405, partial [Sphingomonas sp. PsM26]|nr:hypothetical protein [Sphingomonas sp. PsM26]